MYEMNIYWSDIDDRFLVEVPELPGCMADGKTRAEAVINAERIIDEWIDVAREDGREIPKPRKRISEFGSYGSAADESKKIAQAM